MASRPYQILVLTKGYARYRENLVSSLAAALPPGYSVLHSTPHFGDDLWEVDWEALLQDGGSITHLNFPKIGLGTYVQAVLARFGKAHPATGYNNRSCRLEDIAPDMVLIQEYSAPMLLTALYCRLRGIPCIVCSDLGRDTDWSQFSWKTHLVHYLAGGLTTGVIAHTKVANIPPAHVHRPVCFIPHSVDIRSLTRSSHQSQSGTVRILMVAQYIPRKGHDLLAKALRILIKRGRENFELRLVGTQDPTWLESVISAEGLQKFVTVCGVLKGENLYSEFSQADIFVLTSRFDTFAVVVHEAAAFGLPLLISKHAESSSLLVAEGINGFVIDPYDSETLADRFEHLIDHPDIRHEMGRESRKIGEDLCASKMGIRLADWLLEHARKFQAASRPS